MCVYPLLVDGVNLGQITTGKSHTHSRPVLSFGLTKELLDFAENAAPDLDPEAKAEKCLDYFRARGRAITDWPATWRELDPRSFTSPQTGQISHRRIGSRT